MSTYTTITLTIPANQKIVADARLTHKAILDVEIEGIGYDIVYFAFALVGSPNKRYILYRSIYGQITVQTKEDFDRKMNVIIKS